MAIQKPSIPKGTRDFSPKEMVRRYFIFSTVTKIFQRYGYVPIETPTMENLSTLMGKYGEEGDKLLFKILNSGDYLSEVKSEQLTKGDHHKITPLICEKGLRYDLTVPFARYVVQHQHEITFPFKRYQVQPVWRADRPQKGRYREFYQCDVDVVGSNSLLNEVEMIQIVDDVFHKLRINTTIKINNRKILSGIAELIGEPKKIIDITVAIDKIDKIGIEKVNQELLEKGLNKKSIEKLQPFLSIKGNNKHKLEILKKLLDSSDIAKKGIEEVETILDYLTQIHIATPVEIDITLARGLNYYTGAIFEVKATKLEMGSICGGGRYDDLTGIFGLPNISGVGISFGADRIYDLMEELNLFPEDTRATTQVLFVNFGNEEEKYCLPIITDLRKVGINVELYPDTAKIKKQLSYANDKKIPFVALIGKEEISSGQLILKSMKTGEQKHMTKEELMSNIKLYFESRKIFKS